MKKFCFYHEEFFYLVYWCSHKNIISRSVHGAKIKSSLFKHRLSNLLLQPQEDGTVPCLFSEKMLIRSDLDWIRAFLPKRNGSGFSNPDFPTRNGPDPEPVRRRYRRSMNHITFYYYYYRSTVRYRTVPYSSQNKISRYRTDT
jgi:hypothetical protein